jgi:hypothetical protein
MCACVRVCMWGGGIRVKHLHSLSLSPNYFCCLFFVNLKMIFKFLVQTIHSGKHSIGLIRRINQIIDSDIFHDVLLISAIYRNNIFRCLVTIDGDLDW